MNTGWGTKHTTKIKKLTTVTTSEFDAMTKDELIVEKVTGSTVSGESADNVQAGNIIGFITDAGKKGLIKVNSASSSQITITVKVQK
jgi:hypothetical protein